MSYLSMGIPSNYINHPLYQQYAQMIMQSAQMTQNMMLQKQQELAKQNALYQQQLREQQEQQIAERDAIAAQQAAEEQKMAQADAEALAKAGAKDGHDDGKISFGSKVKNLGKGVVNFFKGMVCDENGKFSIKRTLTTAAIAAGATVLTIATGGAATPFLIAAGTTLGAFEVGKGAYKAATAKTDAEAEAAWQNIGSGATAVIGSIVGAKSALKSAKVDVSGYKGIEGALKATGNTFKYSYDKVGSGISHIKVNGFRNSIGTAKTTMANNLKTGWESAFKSTNAKNNTKAQFEAKYDAKIAKTEAKIDALTKEIGALKNDPVKNATQIAKKQNEMTVLLKEKSVIEAQKANIPEFTKRGLRNKQLENLKAKKELFENYINATKDKALKNDFQAKLENINTRIAEVEKFAEIEKAQNIIANAKSKLPKSEAKLKKINKRIESIKNNTVLTAEEKTTALAKLAKEQANVLKLVNTAKAQITAGKRSLHWQNAKIFESANRKSIGYPTVAITGGGVTTQEQVNVADEYAKAYGFNSAEEMQQYLDAQNAQYAQALANSNYQQKTNTTQNTAVANTTNPYIAQNIFANTASNMLGFNDLYVSPYADYAV